MTIEIVDFPIKNGGSFHSYVNQLTSLGVVSAENPKALGSFQGCADLAPESA